MSTYIAVVKIKYEPKRGQNAVILPGESCEALPKKYIALALKRGYIEANESVDDGLIASGSGPAIDHADNEDKGPDETPADDPGSVDFSKDSPFGGESGEESEVSK